MFFIIIYIMNYYTKTKIVLIGLLINFYLQKTKSSEETQSSSE